MTTTFRLPNGVTGVAEERPNSGKVSMQISFKDGSADEALDQNGLTFLMQEATNGGTTTRSRAQLAEDIASKGGGLGTTTTRTATTFGTSVLSRFTKDSFAILADVVRNPAFNATELQKTKALIKQMIDQENESPQKEAAIKFMETALSDQAAGNNPMGTKALVDSFTTEQVKKKHAELLAHPENIVVSFTGDITAAEAEKLLKDYFGDLPAAAPAPARSVHFTPGDYREEQNNEQLNIHFGFEAPPVNDPDRYTAMMLQEALSGGMSSPLFVEIREKRGLVYSVGAQYAPLDNTGIFRIVAGAGKGNAGELISVSMDLLGKIVRDGFDQKSLDEARERYIMGMKEAVETADGASQNNGGQIMQFGRLVSINEVEQQLKKVTPDDIRRFVAKMLKDGNYALSAVGPQDTMPSEQEIKGMMKKQVEGVTLPAIAPKAPAATAQFSKAAQDKVQADAAVEPKVTILKNGLKVLTVERPGSLAMGAWVGAGSDHETPVLGGATHMNEHMMFKGTPSYAPGEIDRIIEGELGGGLNAYTTNDKTAYYFYNLKADALAKVTDIAGQMIFKANLDHTEFDGKMLPNPDGTFTKAKGERDVVIEELKRSNDNINSSSWDLAQQAAYHDQPHGRPVIGTEETLRAMTVEQLAAYRDEYYTPNNVVFAAVGPVKHEDFVALVEKMYGNMPSKDFLPLPKPVFNGETAYAEHKNAGLASVKILAEGVATGDPDKLAYEALAQILGGDTSSRLYQEIVDNKELSAGVGAAAQDWLNGGFFAIMASTDPDKVKPLVSTAYAEMRKLVNTLTQAELDKVKVSMEMNVLSSLETNNDALNAYAVDVQANGKITTAAELSAQIQALTLGDIKRVLNKVLASKPVVFTTVPPGTDPKLLPTQAEVEAMLAGKKAPKTAPQPKTATA